MPNAKCKKKQGIDVAVQGTNDSSVVSKVSAAAQGYFRDELLRNFVCKSSRRAPLINRGYYIRWKAMDHCVKRFLHIASMSSQRQILSLGAGFDSLYFRLRAEGVLEGVVVFEVDFPDVARRKAALIGGNDVLRSAVPDQDLFGQTGPVYVSSAQYKLLGADVRNERQMEDVLNAAGLQWNCPTLVLSEVVLTYMETKWSDSVISWTARSFPQALFVMYEQIGPDDPFGRVMQNHFLKLNSKIHALCLYPDTTTQTQRFLQKGWDKCVCLNMNQFYFSLLSEEERKRVEKIEPFDEFEEWHQKCSHYFILTASKGCLISQTLLSPPNESHIPLMVPKYGSPSLDVVPVAGCPCVEGVGMASATLEPGVLLISGGAGRAGRHSGVRVLIRDQVGWKCSTVEPDGDNAKDVRMNHTLISVPGWGVVVLGGRTSPCNPIDSILRLTFIPSDKPNPKNLCLSVEEMVCTGQAPKPRWRHSSTLLSHGDRSYIFVFGGCTVKEPVLGDAHFLCVEDQCWRDMPVKGHFPEPRHSHSACVYRGGLVIFGGLGREGIPLGDVVLLNFTHTCFCWEKLQLQATIVPRYSHSAQVFGENLVVVGGVWLQADGVPGVAVINLITGGSVELNINTSSVSWPLMLHSFCSELLNTKGSEMVLIGGGGNCFSFGTHVNPHPVTLDLSRALQKATSLDQRL